MLVQTALGYLDGWEEGGRIIDQCRGHSPVLVQARMYFCNTLMNGSNTNCLSCLLMVQTPDIHVQAPMETFSLLNKHSDYPRAPCYTLKALYVEQVVSRQCPVELYGLECPPSQTTVG